MFKHKCDVVRQGAVVDRGARRVLPEIVWWRVWRRLLWVVSSHLLCTRYGIIGGTVRRANARYSMIYACYFSNSSVVDCGTFHSFAASFKQLMMDAASVDKSTITFWKLFLLYFLLNEASKFAICLEHSTSTTNGCCYWWLLSEK